MKRSHIASSALLAILALLFSVGAAQDSDAEALEAVEGVAQQFDNIVSQQDAAAIALLYTEDAKQLSEGVVADGRKGIQELFRGFFDAGIAEVSTEITEAGLLGDTAYGAGTTVVMDVEGEVLNNLNWTGIYKQEGGEWKIHRLMSTSASIPEGTATGGTMTGGGN